MDVKQRCPHEILVPSLSISKQQSIHEDVEMEEVEVTNHPCEGIANDKML